MRYLIPLLLALSCSTISTGCCKTKTLRVEVPGDSCLKGIEPPRTVKVERVPCSDPSAAACYDFENSKKLRSVLAALIDYRDTAETRCRPAPERTDRDED